MSPRNTILRLQVSVSFLLHLKRSISFFLFFFNLSYTEEAYNELKFMPDNLDRSLRLSSITFHRSIVRKQRLRTDFLVGRIIISY